MSFDDDDVDEINISLLSILGPVGNKNRAST
jgi:hypothetical protein